MICYIASSCSSRSSDQPKVSLATRRSSSRVLLPMSASHTQSHGWQNGCSARSPLRPQGPAHSALLVIPGESEKNCRSGVVAVVLGTHSRKHISERLRRLHDAAASDWPDCFGSAGTVGFGAGHCRFVLRSRLTDRRRSCSRVLV